MRVEVRVVYLPVTHDDGDEAWVFSLASKPKTLGLAGPVEERGFVR